jgi:hypothetical protein
MSTSTEQLDKENEALLKRIADRRAPKEHLDHILATTPPFDYGAWVEEAGPPLPEELAEMEDLLAEREVERERST